MSADMITKIEVAEVGADDVVVVRVGARLTSEQHRSILERVAAKFQPDTKVLVLDSGVDLSVLRQSPVVPVCDSEPGVMLSPLRNEHTNTMLGAPRDWDEARDGKCIGLPVHHDKEQGHWHSFWEPSQADLARLVAGMPIRLTVVGGAHPPVAIAVRAAIAG